MTFGFILEKKRFRSCEQGTFIYITSIYWIGNYLVANHTIYHKNHSWSSQNTGKLTSVPQFLFSLLSQCIPGTQEHKLCKFNKNFGFSEKELNCTEPDMRDSKANFFLDFLARFLSAVTSKPRSWRNSQVKKKCQENICLLNNRCTNITAEFGNLLTIFNTLTVAQWGLTHGI